MSLQAARRLRYTIREKLTLIFRHNDDKYHLNTNGTKTETQLEDWSKKLIICKKKNCLELNIVPFFGVFFFKITFLPSPRGAHTHYWVLNNCWLGSSQQKVETSYISLQINIFNSFYLYYGKKRSYYERMPWRIIK